MGARMVHLQWSAGPIPTARSCKTAAAVDIGQTLPRAPGPGGRSRWGVSPDADRSRGPPRWLWACTTSTSDRPAAPAWSSSSSSGRDREAAELATLPAGHQRGRPSSRRRTTEEAPMDVAHPSSTSSAPCSGAPVGGITPTDLDRPHTVRRTSRCAGVLEHMIGGATALRGQRFRGEGGRRAGARRRPSPASLPRSAAWRSPSTPRERSSAPWRRPSARCPARRSPGSSCSTALGPTAGTSPLPRAQPYAPSADLVAAVHAFRGAGPPAPAGHPVLRSPRRRHRRCHPPSSASPPSTGRQV